MKRNPFYLGLIWGVLFLAGPVWAQQDNLWRFLRDVVKEATPAPGLEFETDRPGMDYRSFDLPAADPKLCQKACTDDPKCQAFTYVRPGVQGPNARCWLKSSVPAPVKNQCCVSGLQTASRAASGRAYTAAPPRPQSGLPPAQAAPPGIQVQVLAYGRDESDGSDVGWNSQYPNPSFDDEPQRRGLPNARWQGVHYWQGNQLCLGIQNLEAPYPPAHTLSIGYTVTLQGGTFEDGSASKTLVMYRYAGVPAQKNHTACYRVISMASASTAQVPGGRRYTASPVSGESLLEELSVPNTRPEKVLSRSVLENGREYIIEARGTFDDWGNTPHGIDAVWCFAEWRCGRQGQAWNQLIIDGKGMTEIAGSTIPYNPQHVYRVRYRGQGKRAEFFMSDAQSSSSDNLGALTVRIYASAASPAFVSDLTGRWRGNDGGTYYLRQNGNQLWWFGQSSDGGQSWTNVFNGNIEGSQVRGRWVDVPHGRIMNAGDMILQILAPNYLRATNRTGGFGGSEWTR